MSTHIIFLIKIPSDTHTVIVPYDEEFLGWLKQIHFKYPETLPEYDAYKFTSREVFLEWLERLLPDLINGPVHVYTRPVNKEYWYETYFGDQDWLDFDLIVKHEQEFTNMHDDKQPLHNYFEAKKEEEPSLLSLIYATESLSLSSSSDGQICGDGHIDDSHVRLGSSEA